MKKYKLKKAVPYVLITSMLLSGCGKKSDCSDPTSHVHLYTKEFSNDIKITTYFDDEHLERSGYNWQPELMYIDKDDESFYKAKDSRNLFEADDEDNFPYLYRYMASKHDYLMFYYEYDEEVEYTTKDEDGNEVKHTEIVHHDGWTHNAYDTNNTGKTMLCHHRFYAYRILFNEKNHTFYLDRSHLVDDIRNVFPDYTYACEDCSEVVSETYYFSKWELPHLNAEDFDRFNQPDLSYRTPYKDKTLSLS